MVTRCEDFDQVTRSFDGVELSRATNRCRPPIVRCEGFDQVRRDSYGRELSRSVDVCRPPVRLSADPAYRFGLTQRG